MKKQSQCLSACHDQSQWNGDILCFRQKRDERKRRRRCLDLKTSKQTNERTNQRCRIWFLNNFAKGSVNKKLDMLQTQKVKTSAAVDRSQSSKSWQVLASRHTWARSRTINPYHKKALLVFLSPTAASALTETLKSERRQISWAPG